MRKKSNKPTASKAILAKCHNCMNDYNDGRIDCGIIDCPLYAWMPYREKEPDLSWTQYSPKRRGKKLFKKIKRKKDYIETAITQAKQDLSYQLETTHVL